LKHVENPVTIFVGCRISRRGLPWD